MRPRLLISNDDGIDSPFLPTFARELSNIADIVIVVPADEQSWIGRAYSRHKKLSLKKRDFFNFEAYTVDGTPSDCVNIALCHVCPEVDGVVSGINIGQNVGLPLLWSSGTFSAAAEGASFGFRAFAFSMRLERQFYEECRIYHRMPEGHLQYNLEQASQKAAEYVKKYVEEPNEQGIVHNVNFPILYTKETQFKECSPARAMSAPLYEKKDGFYCFKYAIRPIENTSLTDIECLDSGCACYSKINIWK